MSELRKKELEKRLEAIKEGLDPEEFGNLSSIMINPNEISNAMYASNMLQSVKGQGGTMPFNFMKEMELEEKRKDV